MATMEIAVVGAGIAGLAVAGGLLKRGHDVTIFEADCKIRAGGSGITLGPNALTALDYLGCGEDFRALQQAQPKLYGGQRSQNGRWLSKIAPEITTQSLALDRAELHAILKRHAEGAGLRVGVEVVGVDKQKGALTTKDGKTHTFDLIVGADGIRSAVRAAWPEDPGIEDAGYGTWRGISPKPSEGAVMASESLGVKKRFGIVPLHNDRVYWFAVQSQSPDEQPLSQFKTWHSPIAELIATAEEEPQFLPIRELAGDLNTYTRGKVVLIGDAAHAMTPNLGQGACQALEDAAVLVAQLAKHADLNEALRAFDASRRPRTQTFANQSRTIGKALQAGGPLVTRFRNTMLWCVPNALLAMPVAKLASWRVE